MSSLVQAFENLCIDRPSAIPGSWLQGRTAYGGLSAAMALHVARSHSRPELPPLRAAQIAFIAPVTDPVRFEVEPLRQGKSATQIGVDARVGDATALRASFVFGAARSSALRHARAPRPQVSGPQSYPEVRGFFSEAGHFSNFETRFVGDARPISGADEPELTAWVRLRERGELSPEVDALILGDFMPPATMAQFTAPAPISSVNWAIGVPRPVRSPLNWCLQRTRSLSAGDGYSFQVMEMWDETGELILLSTQTVAIFT